MTARDVLLLVALPGVVAGIVVGSVVWWLADPVARLLLGRR